MERDTVEGRGRPAGAALGSETARLLGGILLGLALVVVWARRSSPFEDPWGAFALAVVLLAAVGLLCGLALRDTGGEPTRWRPALFVFGALLAPLALFQLVAWIDADPDVAFNFTWIFAATAALAALGWRRLGAGFALFLASLYALVSWVSLWDWIADGLGRGGARWVLLIAAAGLAFVAAAVAQRERGARDAGEVLSAAGLALVAAAGLVGLGQTFDTLLFGFGSSSIVADTSLFWNLLLLVGSVALIYAGSGGRPRGPAVVGAIGLLLFVVLVGFDTGRTPDERDGSLFGWPLLLLAAGALLLLSGLRGDGRGAGDRSRRSRAPRAPETTAAAGPPARGGPPAP